MNLALNWLCLLGLISGNEEQKSMTLSVTLLT